MRENSQHYELLYLVAGNIAENEQQPIIDAVKALIENHAGTNLKPFSLGKRRLAFPIEKFKQGFYNGFEFDLVPNELPKLEAALRLERNILRFLTIKKKVLSAAEEARQNKLLSAENKPKSAPSKERTFKSDRPEKKIDVETVAAPASNLEDLNEKLDKILEDDLVK